MWHRADRQTDLRTVTVTTAITVRAVTVRIIVTTVDRTSVARAVTTVTTETAIVTIVRVATDRVTVRADRMVTEEVWAMADLREADLTDRVVRVWKAVRVIAAVTAMVSAVTAITAATEEAMADRVIDSEITDRIRASLRNLQARILRRSAKMKETFQPGEGQQAFQEGPYLRGRGRAEEQARTFHQAGKKKEEVQEEQIKVIVLPESITIKELAEKMKLQPAAIIKKLFLEGKIVTVNQEISYEDAENIAMEYDILCEKRSR